MSRTTRVLVADDQAAFREGLVALLSTLDEVEVVAEAYDGEGAVRLSHVHAPHVVLMDLRMPGVDGVTATRRLSAELPAVKVVVLTTMGDDGSIVEAIAAGALGYLLKDTGVEDLRAAIVQAAAGEAFLSTRVLTSLVQQVARSGTLGPTVTSHDFGLTPRERVVLQHLSRGATNKDIARSLDLAEGTVKNHVSQVFTKLGVADRLQAALLARTYGLL